MVDSHNLHSNALRSNLSEPGSVPSQRSLDVTDIEGKNSTWKKKILKLASTHALVSPTPL